LWHGVSCWHQLDIWRYTKKRSRTYGNCVKWFFLINKIRIQAGDFVGSGSYGCVVSPAVVFPGPRKYINNDNKKFYVTKIASDAKNEYEICETIKDLFTINLPSVDPNLVGIFPVEITCVNKKEFEKFYLRESKNELNSSFFKIIDGEKVFKCQRNLDNIIDSNKKEYCAIQIRRFDYDFADLMNKHFDEYSIREFDIMQKDIFRKLNILHLAGVFHCDIKGMNLAVKNRKIFFVDWGLSELSYPDENVLKYAVQYNYIDVNSDFHNYAFYRLIHNFINKKNRNDLYRIVYKYFEKKQYANCLRVIDIFTLYCAVIADPYVTQNNIRNSEYDKTSEFFYNEILHTIDFYIEKKAGPILYSEVRTPVVSEERSGSRKRKSETRLSSARRKPLPLSTSRSRDTLDYYNLSPSPV
jgi:hypothetical protein